MARIAGVDLPREKRVEIGLTYVFGIGRKTSNEILAKTGINPDTRVKDLTEEEAAKLREVIERDYNVEGDLRREIGLNIKRLVEIGWPAPSPRPAGSRSAHQDQCSYPQGPEEDHCEQEEVRRGTYKWLRYRRRALRPVLVVVSARTLKRARHISVPLSTTRSLPLPT